MKLGNMLLVWLGFIAAWLVAVLLGWGLAFAFSYNVFVPWLGVVPPEYHKLAAFISAFIFDGVGAILVLLTMAGLGIGAYKLFGSRR